MESSCSQITASFTLCLQFEEGPWGVCSLCSRPSQGLETEHWGFMLVLSRYKVGWGSRGSGVGCNYQPSMDTGLSLGTHMDAGKRLQSQSPCLGSGQTASFKTKMLSFCSQDLACNTISQPPILKCTCNVLAVVRSARGMWSLPSKNL